MKDLSPVKLNKLATSGSYKYNPLRNTKCYKSCIALLMDTHFSCQCNAIAQVIPHLKRVITFSLLSLELVTLLFPLITG